MTRAITAPWLRCALLGSALLAACGGTEPDAPPLAEVGEACADDAECRSGLCPLEPARVCTERCTDQDDCEPGLACGLVVASRPDAGTGLEAACVQGGGGAGALGDVCADDGACWTDLCHEGRCTELCGECGPDAVCEPTTLTRFDLDASVSVCRRVFARPDVELGPVVVDETGSSVLSFDVPDGVGSFVIIARYDGAETERVGFLSLVAPDGTVLLDDSDGAPDLNPAAVPYPGASSVLVPSTDDPAAVPQAGRYALRLALYETDLVTLTPIAGEIDGVTVVFEPLGQDGGLLDLNLFLSPGTGLDASSADGDPFVADVLSELSSYLEGYVDARLGEVAFFDVGAELDSIADSAQARRLCESASIPGTHGVAVNVVLVQSLAFAGGFTAGAPAPPGLFGAPPSCIVAARQSGARRTGVLVAHEIGHFLGLGHTTDFRWNEGAGRYEVVDADPISDTVMCTDTADLTGCPDHDNLMFPVFPSDGLRLTPGQVAVARGNPVLYEITQPRACSAVAMTYDVTASGFATGDTSRLDDRLSGSCGGAGAPERLQLLQLTDTVAALEVRVTGRDFAPVVHVRRDDCTAAAAEVACASADAGEELVVRVDDPAAGAYFIAVDGRDGGGGRFRLEASSVP